MDADDPDKNNQFIIKTNNKSFFGMRILACLFVMGGKNFG